MKSWVYLDGKPCFPQNIQGHAVLSQGRQFL